LYTHEYVNYYIFVVKYQIVILVFYFNYSLVYSHDIMIKHYFKLTPVRFGHFLYPWQQRNRNRILLCIWQY